MTREEWDTLQVGDVVRHEAAPVDATLVKRSTYRNVAAYAWDVLRMDGGTRTYEEVDRIKLVSRAAEAEAAVAVLYQGHDEQREAEVAASMSTYDRIRADKKRQARALEVRRAPRPAWYDARMMGGYVRPRR